MDKMREKFHKIKTEVPIELLEAQNSHLVNATKFDACTFLIMDFDLG